MVSFEDVRNSPEVIELIRNAQRQLGKKRKHNRL